MPKYVCEACGGESEMPGTCQTEGCSMHGQELKEAPAEAPVEQAPAEETPAAPEAPADAPAEEQSME